MRCHVSISNGDSFLIPRSHNAASSPTRVVSISNGDSFLIPPSIALRAFSGVAFQSPTEIRSSFHSSWFRGRKTWRSFQSPTEIRSSFHPTMRTPSSTHTTRFNLQRRFVPHSTTSTKAEHVRNGVSISNGDSFLIPPILVIILRRWGNCFNLQRRFVPHSTQEVPQVFAEKRVSISNGDSFLIPLLPSKSCS